MPRPAALVAGLAVSAAALLPAASASASTPPMVTLLFSRTEVGAASGCTPTPGAVSLLDDVAPWLAARGLAGTGTLVTGKTTDLARGCTHWSQSLTASWQDAQRLSTEHGWSFVSHTATYDGALDTQPADRRQAETCGSADAIDDHGLHGGHGLIAYPGASALPVQTQQRYGAQCFAWGRVYGSTVNDTGSAATAPFWEVQGALNGGPCAAPTAPCHTITSRGRARYVQPSTVIAKLQAVKPGQWTTVQAYLLVTGAHTGTGGDASWDCRSADPALHWSDDNERYCWKDYVKIVTALQRTGARVVDPLTAGVALGRPATYPRAAQ